MRLPRISALALWRTLAITLMILLMVMARYGSWPQPQRSYMRLAVDLVVIFCWLTPAIGTFYILRHLRALRRRWASLDERTWPRGDA